MPTSRASFKDKLRSCAEPAPVPLDIVLIPGVNAVGPIKGLLIDPDTGILFTPDPSNAGTVVQGQNRVVVPSAVARLGTVNADAVVTNPQGGDVFYVYLIGPCARKEYVGTATISIPPP